MEDASLQPLTSTLKPAACNIDARRSVNLTFVVNVRSAQPSPRPLNSPEKKLSLMLFWEKEGKHGQVEGLSAVTPLLKQKQQSREWSPIFRTPSPELLHLHRHS